MSGVNFKFKALENIGVSHRQPVGNTVPIASAVPLRNPTDPRSFERIKPGSGTIELEVMDYVKDTKTLRPLLILSPIDFPYPPSIAFCEMMKRNGFRVIYIRRLGFGGTPALPRQLLTESNVKGGAAIMAEVAVIMRAIAMMDLEDVVLLGVSSANPVCYRLCQTCPAIGFTVFSHPTFNQDTFEAVRPIWIQPVARQIVLTKLGFKLAARGLRFKIKRNALSFYDDFYAKSAADLKYRLANEKDFLAAATFVEQIAPETLYYEVFHTLAEDPFLRDGLFLNVPSVVLAGSETTTHWLASAEAEANRLKVPFVKAPRGGILTAYASPDSLLQVINTQAT
ncbi:MAG: hypothetical protein AAFY82_01095 [Pseudomonadota bacterium]